MLAVHPIIQPLMASFMTIAALFSCKKLNVFVALRIDQCYLQIRASSHMHAVGYVFDCDVMYKTYSLGLVFVVVVIFPISCFKWHTVVRSISFLRRGRGGSYC